MTPELEKTYEKIDVAILRWQKSQSDADFNDAFLHLHPFYRAKLDVLKQKWSSIDPDEITSVAHDSLLYAARTFRADGGRKFRYWYELIVGTRMCTAARTYCNRQMPLRSIERRNEEGICLGDTLVSPDEFSTRQYCEWIWHRIEEVRKFVASPLEKRVLDALIAVHNDGWSKGKSPQARIAEVAGLNVKVVDNALLRLREKLRSSANIPLTEFSQNRKPIRVDVATLRKAIKQGKTMRDLSRQFGGNVYQHVANNPYLLELWNTTPCRGRQARPRNMKPYVKRRTRGVFQANGSGCNTQN